MNTEIENKLERLADGNQNILAEFKMLSFLIQHPENIDRADPLLFTNEINKNFFKAISFVSSLEGIELNDYNIHVNWNEKFERPLSTGKIQNVIDYFDPDEDSLSYEYHEGILKQAYYRSVAQRDILSEAHDVIQSKGKLSSKNLYDLAEKFVSVAYSMDEQNNELLSAEDMAKQYKDILLGRREGKRVRTLGYRDIDNLLTRPAAEGEMTSFVAMTGVGKTTLLQNIIDRITSQKVCVLSLNFEMSLESNMDRAMSRKYGHDMKELNSSGMKRRKLKKLFDDIDRFAENDYLLFYPNPGADFNKIDQLIYKAKDEFKRKGILPDDGYIVVTFDAVSHVDDFSDEDVRKVNMAVKKQHTLIRKHMVHAVNVMQANENKFRSGKFKFSKPEDADNFSLSLEDIYGGSAYSKYSRALFTLNRPLLLKQRFFPDMADLWDIEAGIDGEGDILTLNLIKQNDGGLGSVKLVFGKNMRLTPFRGKSVTIREDE